MDVWQLVCFFLLFLGWASVVPLHPDYMTFNASIGFSLYLPTTGKFVYTTRLRDISTSTQTCT